MFMSSNKYPSFICGVTAGLLQKFASEWRAGPSIRGRVKQYRGEPTAAPNVTFTTFLRRSFEAGSLEQCGTGTFRLLAAISTEASNWQKEEHRADVPSLWLPPKEPINLFVSILRWQKRRILCSFDNTCTNTVFDVKDALYMWLDFTFLSKIFASILRLQKDAYFTQSVELCSTNTKAVLDVLDCCIE